jgi:hypothetical protein
MRVVSDVPSMWTVGTEPKNAGQWIRVRRRRGNRALSRLVDAAPRRTLIQPAMSVHAFGSNWAAPILVVLPGALLVLGVGPQV